MVLAQVDSDHESAAADLGDLRHRRNLVEQLAEEPDLGLQAQQGVLRLERVQAGDGRRAGERAAGEGVAVEERPSVLGRSQESLVYALGRERRRQRQVAAGESLAQAQEV